MGNNRIRIVKPEEITESFILNLEKEYPYFTDKNIERQRSLAYISFDIDYLVSPQVRKVLKCGGAITLIVFQFLREAMGKTQAGYFIDLSEVDQNDLLADIAYDLRISVEDAQKSIDILKNEKLITVVRMSDGRIILTSALQIRNFEMINIVRKQKYDSAQKKEEERMAKAAKRNNKNSKEPLPFPNSTEEMEQYLDPFTGNVTSINYLE